MPRTPSGTLAEMAPMRRRAEMESRIFPEACGIEAAGDGSRFGWLEFHVILVNQCQDSQVNQELAKKPLRAISYRINPMIEKLSHPLLVQ